MGAEKKTTLFFEGQVWWPHLENFFDSLETWWFSNRDVTRIHVLTQNYVYPRMLAHVKSHGFFSVGECPIASIKSRQISKNRGYDTSESSVGFLHPKFFSGTFWGGSSASIPASLTLAAECLSFALLLHSIYSSSLPVPERNQFNKNVSKMKQILKRGGESPIPVGMMPHKNTVD